MHVSKFWAVYRDLRGAIVRRLLTAETPSEAVAEGVAFCKTLRAEHRAALGAYLDRAHPRAFLCLRIEETSEDPVETCDYVWVRRGV